MGESWASANRRRACLDCGESGADLYHTRDGRDVRVCRRCVENWVVFGLQGRAPLYEESEYQRSETADRKNDQLDLCERCGVPFAATDEE